MHDLVLSDLEKLHFSDEARELVRARKQLGLDRYQSLLQAHNGRDARQDATEELADAACYIKQMIVETGTYSPRTLKLEIMFQSVLFILSDLCAGRDEPADLTGLTGA